MNLLQFKCSASTIALATALFVSVILPIARSANIPGQSNGVDNDTKTKREINLPPCNSPDHYLDSSLNCKLCTVCRDDQFEISECTTTKDRICRYCPKGEVMSEMEGFCRPCGCCTGFPYKHQIQNDCLAAGKPTREACMTDGPCPSSSAAPSTTPPANITAETQAEVKIDRGEDVEKGYPLAVVLAAVSGLLVVVVLVLGVCQYRRCTTKRRRNNQINLPVKYIPQAAGLSREETQPGAGEAAVGGRGEEEPNSSMEYEHADTPFIRQSTV